MIVIIETDDIGFVENDISLPFNALSTILCTIIAVKSTIIPEEIILIDVDFIHLYNDLSINPNSIIHSTIIPINKYLKLFDTT